MNISSPTMHELSELNNLSMHKIKWHCILEVVSLNLQLAGKLLGGNIQSRIGEGLCS